MSGHTITAITEHSPGMAKRGFSHPFPNTVAFRWLLRHTPTFSVEGAPATTAVWQAATAESMAHLVRGFWRLRSRCVLAEMSTDEKKEHASSCKSTENTQISSRHEKSEAAANPVPPDHSPVPSPRHLQPPQWPAAQ